MKKPKTTLRERYDAVLMQDYGTTLERCSVVAFSFPGGGAVRFFYRTLGEHLRGYIYDQVGDRVIIILPPNSPTAGRIRELAVECGGRPYEPGWDAPR